MTLNKNLKFPVAVSELQESLPHREPMVWISQVNWVNSKEGECLVQLDPQAHYMDGKKIRQTSVVEWIAQTYGFVSACQNLVNDTEVQTKLISKAYLISIKDVEIFEGFNRLLDKETSLLVYVKTLRDLNPMKSIYGEIKTKDGKKIATGEVKVFSEG